MSSLTIHSKTIDKYFKKPLKYYNIDLPKPLLMIQEGIIRKYFKGLFNYLKKLDNRSKKERIVRLTESLDSKREKPGEVSSLFGAWKDDRSSDEIIRELIEERVESKDPEKFE